MADDPVRVTEVQAWLVKAGRDLRAARIDLQVEPPILDHVVFHAQQATEKALKAFLSWHDQPFRKTHNLIELGRPCVGIDASLELLLHRAAPLSEYAWKFRYPGDPAEPSRTEAEAALEVAREVFEAVLARLPDEVRP